MNMKYLRERGTLAGEATSGNHVFSSTSAVLAFSVSVVDGGGVEVYGEPVTATVDLGDGYQRTLTRTTGRDGWAHFVEDTGVAHGVKLTAGRESYGPLRPAPGERLVIEA